MRLFIFTWGHGCALVVAKTQQHALELLMAKRDCEWETNGSYELSDDYTEEGDVEIYL